MREILFRGKQKHGEWVYGGFYSWDDKLMICQIDTSDVTPFVLGIEAIPETVGQFTGLYDCNGKTIFEHDVVREIHSGYTYVVKYIGAQFYCWNDGGGFRLFEPEHLEIIGNIHDNPELVP